MISPSQADEIVTALRIQRRAALREEGDQAERLSAAINQVLDWAEGKITGPFPLDLAQYGLEHMQAQPEADAEPASAPDASEPTASLHPAPAARVNEAAQQIDRKEELRRQARAAEAAGDSTRAGDLWRQLLAIAPDDLDAKKALLHGTATILSQALRNKIAEVRQKSKSQSISELDEAIQKARELLSSGDLDDEVYTNVQEWEESAKQKRADLKAKAGDIETMAGIGQLKEAIKRLEDQIRAGQFEFPDREGNIVSTSAKLAEYNQAYALFCTQKAKEYLARAEQSLPAFPKTADQVLDEALQTFDKADPETRADVERRRAEVRELITRWDAAQELIAQSQHEINPEKRLALLEDARTKYSGVENLETMIAEARKSAAAALIQDIKIIHQRATFALADGRLHDAQQEALKARERAKDVRGVFEQLEKELDLIDLLVQKIVAQTAIRRQAAEAEASIQTFLKKRDFASAAQRIELLSEEVREQDVIKTLEGRIARERGAETTFRLAEKRFSAGDWQGVQELLEPDYAADETPEKALQLDERMTDLLRQASARLAYQEGVDNLQEDPVTAERSFEIARLTDPTLKEMVQPYLDQIAARKQQLAIVQGLLTEAERLQKGNKLSEAYYKLTEAQKISSPLPADADARLIEVKNAWRTQLLEELEPISTTSERMVEIIGLLRDNNLLDSYQDEQTVTKAELTYYRSQAVNAAKAKPSPRWADAVTAWSSYLKIDGDNVEAQEGMQQALREATLAEARRIFTSTKDGASALDLMDTRLQDERLQTDPLFLAELVTLACQDGDFERAQQYWSALRQEDKPGSSLVEDRAQLIRETQAWADALRLSKDSFNEGRFLSAVQLLDNVLQAFPGAEAAGQWKKKRDEVQRQAVGALMAKARELRRQVSGPGRTEVISLYSQAIQLGGDEAAREAKTAIDEIKSELPDLVRVVVDEAERYSPDNTDPIDAQRETERQLTRLNDFRQVTNYMGPEGQKWRSRIDAAAQKLGTQNDMLIRVNKLLFQVRSALREPNDDKSLASAETNLKQAKSLFARATGITELQSDLTNLKADRAKAKQLIEDLKRAAKDEDNPDSYRTVLEVSRQLRQLDPEDRFHLQQQDNLLVYYDFSDETVDSMEQHERLARERQENYRIYREWYEKADDFQNRLQAALNEVREKRSKGALEEQQEALQRALDACTAALGGFTLKPSAEPQCYPSQAIFEEIGEWIEQATKHQADLGAELAAVGDTHKRRDLVDAQLTKLLNAKPITANKSAASRAIDQLQNLDPNWPYLASRRRKVNEWQAQKSSRFSFGGK